MLTFELANPMQAAHELRGNHLGRANEEGFGEVLGGHGGYGFIAITTLYTITREKDICLQ